MRCAGESCRARGLQLAPVSSVLFGSDFPRRPVSEVVAAISKYEFSDSQRDSALRPTREWHCPLVQPNILFNQSLEHVRRLNLARGFFHECLSFTPRVRSL